ncbi:Serine/threonine-protein kinase spk-1 [Paramyrothecium foliicola]|nr:Serine/threonine-protein kinase spk-1 [Paramyrothecium foliicola]
MPGRVSCTSDRRRVVGSAPNVNTCTLTIRVIEAKPRYKLKGFSDILASRYRLVDKLGYGGYSIIWLARDNQQGRCVAIKVPISGASRSMHEPKILRALACAALDSSHSRASPLQACDAVPSILDEFVIHGPNGTHPCYVMVPVQGNLKEASFSRLFPVNVARALAAKLALAVAFVHAHGFVHGAFDELSDDEFMQKFGEPETTSIRRVDGKPLTSHVPSQAVHPLYMGKKAQYFTLDDSRDLILGDFGEAFAPATEQRLGRDCNTPLAKRAPETLFSPDEPLSYPSDVWSLGTAIWEILGMKFIFSEAETADEIVAQQLDVLGSQGFPADWQRSWERLESHKADEDIPRRPTGSREAWPPLEEAFEEFVQNHRRKREMAGTFDQQEERAILDLMRGMLKFRPEDRLTMDEVLRSEWMLRWALPALNQGRHSGKDGLT